MSDEDSDRVNISLLDFNDSLHKHGRPEHIVFTLISLILIDKLYNLQVPRLCMEILGVIAECYRR